MTDTHVVSAPKEERMQVTSQIEALLGQLRQVMMGMRNGRIARDSAAAAPSLFQRTQREGFWPSE